MTKRFWSSLVLGMTLSAPTLLVGCGEETGKSDAVKTDAAAPATTATPVDASKTPVPAK